MPAASPYPSQSIPENSTVSTEQTLTSGQETAESLGNRRLPG